MVAAAAHIVWPAAAIDAVFLTLLGFAGIVMFFDIEKVGALGIVATRRQIGAAKRRVQTVDAKRLEIPPPKVPSVTVEASGVSSKGEVGRVTVGGDAYPRSAGKSLTPPVNPGERLLWLFDQIRIELVVIAGNAGKLPDRRPWSEYDPSQLAVDLADRRLIPTDLSEPVRVFAGARHRFLAGGLRPGSSIEYATTLGADVLIKLRDVRRSYFRVKQSPVQLFRDPGATIPAADVKGVMLEQINADGRGALQVFPADSTYEPGTFVSWEWDMLLVLRTPAWYRLPEEEDPLQAWSEAATFVGRPYPEEWGVEYRLPGPMRPPP